MKQVKVNYFLSFVVLSLVLIIAVPLTDSLISFFCAGVNGPNQALPYSGKQMLSGILSETIRAIITVFLYSTTLNKGVSIWHGIKYGLLYSALIASLYIILGGFYFQTKDPVKFVIVDSFILLIQGVLSGIVLYYFFRKKRNPGFNTDLKNGGI